MDVIETAWLAGLIEGEGYIGLTYGKWPRITVQMTDEDVLQRAAKITGLGNIYAMTRKQAHWKPAWVWAVQAGKDAAYILRAIRPWMGLRRGSRIDEVLKASEEWDESLRQRRPTQCSECGRPVRAHGLCSTHYSRLYRAELIGEMPESG